MPTRTRIKKPKLGDVFEMDLPTGKLAYAQYVWWSDELGYLVRVYDLISSESIADLDMLVGRGLLFPPVFTGLVGTLRRKRWRVIGNLPVTDFSVPKFRYTHGTKPGTYHNWLIWDGVETIHVGDLPVELRSLELKLVWGDEGLEERVVNGTYIGDRLQ